MQIGHKAVFDTCRALEKRGWVDLIYLQVDSKGYLGLDHLEDICAAERYLLGVMTANNEVDNIYPVEVIGQST